MAEEKKDTEKKQSSRKPAARKSGTSTTRKSGGSGTRRSSAKSKETATKESGTAAKATSKTADAKASEKATARTKSTATKPAAGSTAKKEPAKRTPAKKAKTEAKTQPRSKRAAEQEAAERPVVNARARFVRVAPRKARLIADQVRGLPLEDALPLLRFSTRSAAQDIRKLLESAAANAEANHDLVADDLRIKDIHVDEGPTLRRYRPRALGRATRINKRTSHIVVALTPED
jgi:ribosomal protein L22